MIVSYFWKSIRVKKNSDIAEKKLRKSVRVKTFFVSKHRRKKIRPKKFRHGQQLWKKVHTGLKILRLWGYFLGSFRHLKVGCYHGRTTLLVLEFQTIILAEGAIALPVTLSGGALFASWKLFQFPSSLAVKVILAIFMWASAQQCF